MDPDKTHVPKIALALSIVLFLVIAVIVYFNFEKRETVVEETPQEEPVGEDQEGAVEDGFLTYRSEELDFEIDYPKGWIVESHFDDPIYPRVNFYPPGQGEIVQPITHHSDLTHVSIFPEGIPTEGIFGENRPSDIDFAESVRVAIDFYLRSGEEWATFVGFEDMPGSWGDAGFVFSRIQIKNLEESCFRDEEKLPDEECDPLTGDLIAREGSVDSEMREIHERMLESFEFIAQ